MTSVLVADSDESLASAMRRSLSHFGIEAVTCCSASTARAHLDQQRFDLLVLDQRLIVGSGYGSASMHESLPTIFTASFVGPLEEQTWVRGLTLLCKPFSSLELIGAVRRELGQPSARAASTVDALRRAHAGKRSLCLCLRSRCQPAHLMPARIYLEGGEVVHAVAGAALGSAALRELLRLRGPSVEQSADRTPTRSIQRPFKPLIFELLQELDAFSTVARKAFPLRATGLETAKG
jgi:CheY-like chemotaxis protein